MKDGRPTCQFPVSQLTLDQLWQERAQWMCVLDSWETDRLSQDLEIRKTRTPEKRQFGEQRFQLLNAEIENRLQQGEKLSLFDRIQPTMEQWNNLEGEGE